MNGPHQLASGLAPRLADFIVWKRCQGYDYGSPALRLGRFDRFLCARQYRLPILTADIVTAYADSLGRLTPLGRHGEMSAVRAFSRYLNLHRPDSYVVPDGQWPVRYRPRFHLYSQEELARLLAAARRLPRTGPTVHLLLGLLYSTGLRISEALALDLADVDLGEARLLVRRGKFGKDRWGALHPTVVRRLRHGLRGRPTGTGVGQPLFTNERGARLGRKSVEHLFRRLVQACGIDPRPAGGPRLHDLRHTYACDCLERWQQQGLDLEAMLPVLATALGHTGLYSSQIYLHTTAAQLQRAGEQLRCCVQLPMGEPTP